MEPALWLGLCLNGAVAIGSIVAVLGAVRERDVSFTFVTFGLIALNSFNAVVFAKTLAAIHG